jgi:hypothetical protein
MVYLTVTVSPTCACGGTVTSVTFRSAGGGVCTSIGCGAAVALFWSLPNSSTWP